MTWNAASPGWNLSGWYGPSPCWGRSQPRLVARLVDDEAEPPALGVPVLRHEETALRWATTAVATTAAQRGDAADHALWHLFVPGAERADQDPVVAVGILEQVLVLEKAAAGREAQQALGCIQRQL